MACNNKSKAGGGKPAEFTAQGNTRLIFKSAALNHRCGKLLFQRDVNGRKKGINCPPSRINKCFPWGNDKPLIFCTCSAYPWPPYSFPFPISQVTLANLKRQLAGSPSLDSAEKSANHNTSSAHYAASASSGDSRLLRLQSIETQYPFVPSSHSKRRFMSGEMIASDGTPVLNHSSSSTSSLNTAQYHVDANGNPLIDQETRDHFMAMGGRMPEDELHKQPFFPLPPYYYSNASSSSSVSNIYAAQLQQQVSIPTGLNNNLAHLPNSLQRYEPSVFVSNAMVNTAPNPVLLNNFQPGMAQYEGPPIFLLHNSGLSANAVQTAAEFKMATQALGTLPPKVDTSRHFHVFVGDLATDVDNDTLKEAFKKKCPGEISEAKVIRDQQSHKSRGYGFVSFPNKEDAQKAIELMNGEMIGRRAVRTNWASRRASVSASVATTTTISSSEEEKTSNKESDGSSSETKVTFDEIFNAADANNTTVYLGNLALNPNRLVTEETIRDAFGKFGDIREVKLFASQNYGFVVFEKKESAARAIHEMNGHILEGGQSVKCSWGRGGTHASNSHSNSSISSTFPDSAAVFAQSNQAMGHLHQQSIAANQNAALINLSQQIALGQLQGQIQQPRAYPNMATQQAQAAIMAFVQQQQMQALHIQRQQQLAAIQSQAHLYNPGNILAAGTTHVGVPNMAMYPPAVSVGLCQPTAPQAASQAQHYWCG
ncbi:RNA recognition motif domain-containing protein [Ditylenchus destructor]|nr:RNA recognition motif domain-containing protein [Ditylenchus destructor]